jgi:hypothetical protein
MCLDLSLGACSRCGNVVHVFGFLPRVVICHHLQSSFSVKWALETPLHTQILSSLQGHRINMWPVHLYYWYHPTRVYR